MTPSVIDQQNTSASSKAALRTISCSELQNQDPQALKHLLLAATEDGIFYLDFDLGNRAGLDQSIHDVHRLSHAIFDMPMEEKLAFDIDTMGSFKLNGYKPVGRNKGGIPGHRDGFESYAISQDTIRASPDHAVQHPPVVAEHHQSLAQLTSQCLDTTRLIFTALSRAFRLPPADSFESRHDTASSPLDLLRLLRYPDALAATAFDIPQLAHADMGSLTFLFTSAPGLQILPKGTDQWRDVLPVPGRAIVNFGDAVKILSGGRVESVVHRVVTIPAAAAAGEQQRRSVDGRDRYSFAFLVRPAPEAHIAALPGLLRQEDQAAGAETEPPMTCEEWVSMRFSQLRAK